MTEPGEWIQGDDSWAQASAPLMNRGRWERRAYGPSGADIAPLLDAPWGTHDDTFPGAEATPRPPFLTPNSTYVSLSSSTQVTFRPTVHEYTLPVATLSDPARVPPAIPEGEWPEGAVGYEWETPFLTWLQVGYTVLATLGRTSLYNSASSSHLCHLLQAPASWLPTTPAGSGYPRRTADYGSWVKRFEGTLISTDFIGLWEVVTWDQLSADITVMPAPSCVTNGSGFVNELFAFAVVNVRGQRTFRPPRHRFLFGDVGMWTQRQRHTAGGNSGGWPERQRHHLGFKGSWSERQRHTGI